MNNFAYLLGDLGADGLRGNVVLAPMSGLTDLGMRRAAERFGASFVISEMVDSDLYAKGDALNRLKAEGDGIDRHVVQIAGFHPERLAHAARLAEAHGAAMVDINMGCPAKKVVGGFAGSALMRDLEQATSLIRATVRAVSVPVSVKMRLGWDDGSINAAELARRAESEGAVMVTVHGRTRCQFYKGRAEWAAIRAVKQAVSIPVVANGDCMSLADARRMLTASCADAVMIGRAAVGQPWLVGAIARALAAGTECTPVPLAARREAAVAHYETLLSLYGRDQGVRHARKHLAGYALHAGVPPGSPTHRALVTSDEPSNVIKMLGTVFDGSSMEVAA